MQEIESGEGVDICILSEEKSEQFAQKKNTFVAKKEGMGSATFTHKGEGFFFKRGSHRLIAAKTRKGNQALGGPVRPLRQRRGSYLLKRKYKGERGCPIHCVQGNRPE